MRPYYYGRSRVRGPATQAGRGITATPAAVGLSAADPAPWRHWQLESTRAISLARSSYHPSLQGYQIPALSHHSRHVTCSGAACHWHGTLVTVRDPTGQAGDARRVVWPQARAAFKFNTLVDLT